MKKAVTFGERETIYEQHDEKRVIIPIFIDGKRYGRIQKEPKDRQWSIIEENFVYGINKDEEWEQTVCFGLTLTEAKSLARRSA